MSDAKDSVEEGTLSAQAQSCRAALRVLFSHGWTEEQRVKHCAAILADVSLAMEFDAQGKSYDPDGPEAEAHFKQGEYQARTRMSLDQCVDCLLYHVHTSNKPGLFKVNDELVDPMDGIALDLLERTVRFHLDMSGELQDEFLSATNILNVENARSFLKNLREAKPDEPVLVRGIGSRLPLYFTPEPGEVIPQINIPKSLEALKEEYDGLADVSGTTCLQEYKTLITMPRKRAQDIYELAYAAKHQHAGPGMA